ncbi:MAG: glycosyltransferase family 9 protein, partial [Candidatus Sumerlaeia bacterium]|nr:glycosyltransferase family 9 protein [Candidatus Sumerlaeia bacterium]
LEDFLFANAKTIARKIFVTGYRIKKPSRTIKLSTASTVLLVNSGYVGDFIIIQPAIRALRRALPNSKFIFLCNEPGRQLYELLDSPLPVDEIYCLPANKSQQPKLITHLLKEYKFNATLFFYYHNASCQKFFFHRLAPPTCGFSSDAGFERQLWYDLLDIKVQKDFKQNEILNHFKLVEQLAGIPLRHFIEPYQLFVSYPLQEKYKKLFSNKQLIIGINTGSALPQKRWLPEYWAELIHLLQQEFSQPQIVFIGDKQEQKAVGELLLKISQRKGIFNLAGETSHLLELAALISNFNLLITTDSGPKHLAFALRIPTVTLYGDSDERRWGALWDEDLHLAVRVAPYDLTNDELCDFPLNHRMRLIKPNLVAEAIARLIKHLNLA